MSLDSLLTSIDMQSEMNEEFIVWFSDNLKNTNVPYVIDEMTRIQKIYDEKFNLERFNELYISPNLNQNLPRQRDIRILRTVKNIFTIAVCANRVGHFLDWFKSTKELTDLQKVCGFKLILELIDDNSNLFKNMRDRFDIDFILFQFNMLKLSKRLEDLIGWRIKLSSLYFVNKDINNLRDLYMIFNHPTFPKGLSFTDFLELNIFFANFRHFCLDKKEIEFINFHTIPQSVINKIPVCDINNLFFLKDFYLISKINLNRETMRKFTEELLDKYLERCLHETQFVLLNETYYAINEVICSINSNILTEKLIKKYFELLLKSGKSNFISILQSKYNLKSVLKLMEECV